MQRRDVKREPTYQDTLQADWTAAAGKAGIAYLKEKVLAVEPNRQLRTFYQHELAGLVSAIVAAADKRRRELIEKERAEGRSLPAALAAYNWIEGDNLEGIFPK